MMLDGIIFLVEPCPIPIPASGLPFQLGLPLVLARSSADNRCEGFRGGLGGSGTAFSAAGRAAPTRARPDARAFWSRSTA